MLYITVSSIFETINGAEILLFKNLTVDKVMIQLRKAVFEEEISTKWKQQTSGWLSWTVEAESTLTHAASLSLSSGRTRQKTCVNTAPNISNELKKSFTKPQNVL